MSVPPDRKYLISHEWHKIEGDTCTIGITQFAADELTDITFVQLPEVGQELQAGETFGEIESVKATSDLYTGISGEVIAVNEELANDPSLVNSDPHEAGWMLKIRIADPDEIGKLLNVREYLSQTGAS